MLVTGFGGGELLRPLKLSRMYIFRKVEGGGIDPDADFSFDFSDWQMARDPLVWGKFSLQSLRDVNAYLFI